MHAIIEPTAAHLHCHLSDAPDSLQLDRADALARLQAWGERCAKAVEANDDDALLAIGRELHAWLDSPAWISQWARDEAVQRLEIRAAEPTEPLAAALLACPWEFLADEQGFIAAGRATPLHIIRVRGEASADDIEAAARAVARRSEADAIAAGGSLDDKSATSLGQAHQSREVDLPGSEQGDELAVAVAGKHIAVDTHSHEIIAAELSLSGVTDAEVMPNLLKQRLLRVWMVC